MLRRAFSQAPPLIVGLLLLPKTYLSLIVDRPSRFTHCSQLIAIGVKAKTNRLIQRAFASFMSSSSEVRYLECLQALKKMEKIRRNAGQRLILKKLKNLAFH